MTDAVATIGAQHRSLARDVWRQFWRHKGALGGAAVFALIAIAVLFGSVIHGVDPQYLDYRAKNQGMSLAHPLGHGQPRPRHVRPRAGWRTAFPDGGRRRHGAFADPRYLRGRAGRLFSSDSTAR